MIILFVQSSPVNYLDIQTAWFMRSENNIVASKLVI